MEDLMEKYGHQTVKSGFQGLANGNKQASNVKRADPAKIEVGSNVYRLMPPHATEDGSGVPVIMLHGVWLPAMVDEFGPDGKPTGRKVRKSKRIFNSLKHSTVLKFDLLDEYIKFVEKKGIKKFGDKEKENEEYQTWFAPIKGVFPKNGLYTKRFPFGYVVPVDYKLDKLGDKVQILDFKSLSVTKQLEFLEEQKNKKTGDVGADIYTNINNGSAFDINYTPNQKQESYKVTLYQALDKDDRAIKFPINEDLLMQLESFPSLIDLYGPNVFKSNDFKWQLEGLEIFDRENNYNYFDDPKWIEMVEDFTKEAYSLLGEPVVFSKNSASSGEPAEKQKPISTPKASGTEGLPFKTDNEVTLPGDKPKAKGRWASNEE